MESGVSVVLCCHNSEKRLPKVLEGLNNQKGIDLLQWEIVLVDNASTDHTIEIAKEFSIRYNLPIRINSETRVGLSFARMTGINASRFEFICYVDDDNWLGDNYIATVYEIMQNHEDVGLCGGYSIAAFEGEAPAWFPYFQKCYAVGPQGTESGYLPIGSQIYGAGLTLRKRAWNKLIENGFSYKLTGRKGKSLSSGEDSELCLAIQLAGYRIWYEPSISFVHFMPSVRITYPYLKKLFKAFGKSDVVLNLYNSQFKVHGKYRRIFIVNFYLCLLYYLFALKSPLLNLLTPHDEIGKMRSRLTFHRNMAKIRELFSFFGNYSSMVKSIEKVKFVKLQKDQQKSS